MRMRNLLASLVVIAVPSAAFPGDATPPPPCADTAHAQFDFWIGEWEVTTPDGKPAGTSRVEKILDGCVVFENWKSAAAGYEGKSFNTYDALSGKWNQVWVDTTGATLRFSGALTGNSMDMSGTQATTEGTLLHRMSFTHNPDGTVTQLWRQSRDGKEWETLFDGLYRRKDVDGSR